MNVKISDISQNLGSNTNVPETSLEEGMAIAEFSKFAGILHAALSQHHLLGFEIAQLEFHHLH